MNNKMKYIIIAVVAVILIIAIIIAVIVSKSGKDNDADENESFIAEESGKFEPVSMTDDVQVDFENLNDSLAEEFENHNIETMFTTAYQPEATTLSNSSSTAANSSSTNKTEEKTTLRQQLEQTTVKTENSTSAAKTILDKIDSFFRGKYYFDGIMKSDGTNSPFEIAMNGSDFIVYTEMDGIDMGILCLDDEFYLINPTDKKYTVLSSAIQKMMDIDPDSLKFEFNGTGFDGHSPTEVTEATYNGKPAVCYTYKNSQHNMDFVVVNDEIIQIVQYDASGNVSTILQADEFTVDYSTDMVSLKGYKKTNLISFVMGLMGQE